MIEHLVNARGGDGASAAVDALTADDRAETRILLETWFEERGRTIENALLLSRVRRLLSRSLAESRFQGHAEREARNILQAIALLEKRDSVVGH
jgi:hypothetical protein